MGMALFCRDGRDGTLVSDPEGPVDTQSKKSSGIQPGGQPADSPWQIEKCYGPAEPVIGYSLFHGNLPSGDRSSRGDDPSVQRGGDTGNPAA